MHLFSSSFHAFFDVNLPFFTLFLSVSYHFWQIFDCFWAPQVSFEDFLLWSLSTTFVEETLVPNVQERYLRQLSRDHGLDVVAVGGL